MVAVLVALDDPLTLEGDEGLELAICYTQVFGVSAQGQAEAAEILENEIGDGRILWELSTIEEREEVDGVARVLSRSGRIYATEFPEEQ